MIYKFTNKAKKVIEIANDISIELGHNYIGTEHILYGLVKEGEGIAAKVLTNKGITEDKVRIKIEEMLGQGQKIEKSLGFTPRTKKVLENAIKMGGTTIRSYTSVDGVHGLFQQELYVHGRVNESCKKCNTSILKIKVGGRGTYFCPTCQK